MINKAKFKAQVLPHIIVVFSFIILSCVFMSPYFKNKVLQQADIIQYKGASKEINDHYEKNGERALWTNTLFGGMPSFQISFSSDANIYRFIGKHFTFNLPRPINLLLYGLLGFYVLTIVLGLSPWICLIGSIAFAFSTYSIVIIEAGHNTKLMSLSYVPIIMAGVISLFRGKYGLGLIITTLGLGLNLQSNHFQITYYALIIGLVFAITEMIHSIKNKKSNQFLKACALVGLASVLALGPNITHLWTTYDYSKETIRGGKSELKSNKEKDNSGGLDKDYAQRWSYGKMETLTLMFPDFAGGASGGGLEKDSETYKTLTKIGVPGDQARRFVGSVNTYWGAQPFTSGPFYFGVITCILFVLGCFLLKGPAKLAIIIITLISILLSWGSNFSVLNDFLFNYLPMYNKFRTPSTTLVMAQFSMSLMAVLTLDQLFKRKIDNALLEELKKAGLAVGVLIVCCYLMGISSDFHNIKISGSDVQFKQYLSQVLGVKAEDVFSAIVKDRTTLFTGNVWYAIFLSLCLASLIWLYIKQKIQKRMVLIGVAVLVLGDLWSVGKKYLNDDNFVDKRKNKVQFTADEASLNILRDKTPHYRVLNLASNTFNETLTSYFHHSVGGYHAAKLILYQDLIEHHISKQNMSVWNMLNTRYVIAKSKSDGQKQVQQNPGALGNVWFVDSVMWAQNADEEMNALNNFDPSKTAIVDLRFKDLVSGISTIDSFRQIKLVEYSTDKMTYKYNSEAPCLAVFSEIYYKGNQDWKAYVDGKLLPHFRANYALRAMSLPSGEHDLEFKFEPRSYYVGEKIAMTSSIIVCLLVLGMLMYYSKRHKKTLSQ